MGRRAKVNRSATVSLAERRRVSIELVGMLEEATRRVEVLDGGPEDLPVGEFVARLREVMGVVNVAHSAVLNHHNQLVVLANRQAAQRQIDESMGRR